MNIILTLSLLFLGFEFIQLVSSVGFGCSNDEHETCTKLCGYAGTGRCVNQTHCICETCPQRSLAEISFEYSLKFCSLDPVCQYYCPKSSFSFKNGRIYSGHACSTLSSLWPTCICFCMPTTPSSLLDVLRCPFTSRETSE